MRFQRLKKRVEDEIQKFAALLGFALSQIFHVVLSSFLGKFWPKRPVNVARISTSNLSFTSWT